MGVSTNALLFFGWLFEEGYEFPWDDAENENDTDIDDWWRKVNGYIEPFELWTPDGNYLEGRGETDSKEWFARQREWDTKNPLPFVLVTHCSYDYPMYGIAINKELVAYRGGPVAIDPKTLTEDQDQVSKVRTVCEKYGIVLEGEPQWWLASLWG